MKYVYFININQLYILFYILGNYQSQSLNINTISFNNSNNKRFKQLPTIRENDYKTNKILMINVIKIFYKNVMKPK